MMRRLVFVVAVAALGQSLSPIRPRCRRSVARGGASVARGGDELRDYAGAASGLFASYRVPGALFAGASAGAAFALPLNNAADSFKLALCKRLYALLMVGSLTAQMIVVLVSTVAISSLATRFEEERSLGDFLRRYYYLEYVTTRWNFLSGVVAFVAGVGVRAWISIDCPVIARGALAICGSGSLLALAFVEENSHRTGEASVAALPLVYARLLARRAAESRVFAAAAAASLLTAVYVAWAIPHVVAYGLAVL